MILSSPYPIRLKRRKKEILLFVQLKASELLWDIHRSVLTCFWLPLPPPPPHKAKIYIKKFGCLRLQIKMYSPFLWWDTKNLIILDESLWPLVFKTMWNFFSISCIVRFSVRFSKNVAKTWVDGPENLKLKMLFTWF